MPTSYDHIAEQWHANFRGQAYVDRVLANVDQTLDGLPCGARILDLGRGTGNPIAKHIVLLSYRVVGIDESKEMLSVWTHLFLRWLCGRRSRANCWSRPASK
ncbi:MAG TPA: hypothetical protein VN643_16310 [Pyrinomonadaceae bacterium]|nr:hypothetical protein [Pyrinomonadaceae bacterium]